MSKDSAASSHSRPQVGSTGLLILVQCCGWCNGSAQIKVEQ